VIALLLCSASTLYAASPELSAAMEQEMNRAAAALQLDEQGPPWRISLDLADMVVVDVRAEFGGLVEESLHPPETPWRFLRTEVRQGDKSYDSGDFMEGRGAGFKRLPTELGPKQLARQVWLQIDEAYKGAVSALTQKRVALDPEDADRPALAPAELPHALEWPKLELDPDWVRQTTLALSAVLAEFPELEEAKSRGAQSQIRVLSLSTEGLRLNRLYPELVFRVQAKLRAKDGSLLQNGRSWVVRHRDELPPLESMLNEVREMAQWLAATAEAPVLEDYIGPVLFEQAASVEFFRQLLLPEILGSPPQVDGSSQASGLPTQGPRQARIGRRLLPSGWSIVDDASQPGPGHYSWDFEGIAPERVLVVEDGVLRQPLMSRVPQSFDSKSTGHGRGLGGNRRLAMPGIVTVSPAKALSRGRLEKKAIRAARTLHRDAVLVVRRLESLAMSSQMGVYFRGDEAPPGLTAPTEAYLLYRDGRREPVRSARFLGVDRRAMRDVMAAGQVGAIVGRMDRHPSQMRFSRDWVSGLQSGWATPAILVSELELVSRPGGPQRVLPFGPESAP
jgi:hypothetical protein